MKSAIVKSHNAGLFSLLNNVITCLHIYDRVWPDWNSSAYGVGNLWLELFDPVPPLPHNEPHDTLENYPSQWLTYKHAAKLYEGGCEWREKCNGYWNQLFLRPEISKEALGFVLDHDLQDYISAIVRSHHHAGEQVTEKSQRLDQYAAAIERASGPATRVFLMAGDNETVEWFRARFPVACFEDTPRAQTRATDYMNLPLTFASARRVMVEVMVASAGRALIHPVSNMATAALYIEPEMQSIYIP